METREDYNPYKLLPESLRGLRQEAEGPGPIE